MLQASAPIKYDVKWRAVHGLSVVDSKCFVILDGIFFLFRLFPFDSLLLLFQKPLCSGISQNKYSDGGRQRERESERERA